MSQTTAIVQARTASTRLPNKVLLTFAGRTVLKWVLDRLKRSGELSSIMVATSVASWDDVLAERCNEWGIRCFRGSEQDVLSRFVGAARQSHAHLIVRVNADNPLVDPHYVDELIRDIRNSDAEYESYQLGGTRPVALSSVSFFAEALTRECLFRADRVITDAFEREHVTLGIYRRPSEFRVRFLDVPACCDDDNLRLTLDTAEDSEILAEIFEELGPAALNASAEDVVAIVRSRPALCRKMIRAKVASRK